MSEPSWTATFEEGEEIAHYRHLDGTVIVVTPDEENPGGVCIHCHGPNDHFKDDGTCTHTDEMLAVQRPTSSPMRVLPWRAWGSREAMERAG